eukprot:9930186-Alexandrium_andersonii.AAC.1
MGLFKAGPSGGSAAAPPAQRSSSPAAEAQAPPARVRSPRVSRPPDQWLCSTAQGAAKFPWIFHRLHPVPLTLPITTRSSLLQQH